MIKNISSFWWWWLIITLLITCSNWWSQTLAQNCNKRKICLIDFPHFIHNFHFKLFLTRLNSAQGSTIRTLSNFVIVYLQISVANVLCRDPIHDHIQRTSTVFSWPDVNKMLTTRLFPSFRKVISANRTKPPFSACCGLLLDNPRWLGMTRENRKNLFFSMMSDWVCLICTSNDKAEHHDKIIKSSNNPWLDKKKNSDSQLWKVTN